MHLLLVVRTRQLQLDVLDGLESINICTHYEHRGRRLEVLPAAVGVLEECRPVYETLPGWTETTSGVRSFTRLPRNVKGYLRRIEELTGVPIDIVSIGPDRDQTIVLRTPFAPKRRAVKKAVKAA